MFKLQIIIAYLTDFLFNHKCVKAKVKSTTANIRFAAINSTVLNLKLTILKMKKYSLLLYSLISALNIFLFLPALFYPIIIAPLHILLLWQSFDWLLKNKKFKSIWNRILFSAIPLIGEIVLMILLFTEKSVSAPALVNLLDNIFFLCIVLICFIEFVILIQIYSKYLTRIKNMDGTLEL